MNLPNYITLIRILCVPVFVSLVSHYDANHLYLQPLAVIVFVFAMLTDALDGLIARTFNMQTRLGTYLDIFADKLLLVSAFVVISHSSVFQMKPPQWILIVIIFREILLVFGFLIISIVNQHNLTPHPNAVGKITTFLQMCTIVSLLCQWQVSSFLWLLTAGFTILSAFIYICEQTRVLNQKPSAFISK